MKLIYNVFYTFFGVLEVLLLFYLVISFFPNNNRLRKFITELVNPIIEPIRYLLKYSIFRSNVADFSPLISYIIVKFCQQFFYLLL
ncbi:MAG: hypothetical protein GX323_03835 [Clostridiales bacterium]|nr:hypothetical protein [Clostridiales bacterium]